MAFTYDPTNSVGMVRLNLRDTNSQDAIFQDEEINAFLGMNSSDVNLATSFALLAIANDKARLMKFSAGSGAYSEDPQAAAAEVRKQAMFYRQIALGADESADGVAEWNVTDFSLRERIAKEAINSGY